jgi:hypothetical protein
MDGGDAVPPSGQVRLPLNPSLPHPQQPVALLREAALVRGQHDRDPLGPDQRAQQDENRAPGLRLFSLQARLAYFLGSSTGPGIPTNLKRTLTSGSTLNTITFRMTFRFQVR